MIYNFYKTGKWDSVTDWLYHGWNRVQRENKPNNKIDGIIMKIAINIACCCVSATREISNPRKIMTET